MLKVILSLYYTVLVHNLAYAHATFPGNSNKGKVSQELDSFYDPGMDYSKFKGRVSDINSSGKVIKINAETNNIRFFKIGDRISFLVSGSKIKQRCSANIRDIENLYITVYVELLSYCWSSHDYFRRGTILNIESPALLARIKEASKYRVILLKQREDFLRQLNQKNHFQWTYKQQRLKTAAQYDRKIFELKKAKKQALDELLSSKKDNFVLQRGLNKSISVIDEKLIFFKIDRHEPLLDRWNLDHDLGIPVGRRPQKPKAAKHIRDAVVGEKDKEHRWEEKNFSL